MRNLPGRNNEQKAGKRMNKENVVVCGANAYEEKYYLNPAFSKMPQAIKDELQIMCVMFTQDVGGIFLVELDGDGNLQLRTEAAEEDFTFDEIGSALRIKELQRTKGELFRSLELYYQVIVEGTKRL